MNSPHPLRKRVVVIGGGISGLAAAHRLAELSPGLEVVLLESASRLGGVLETVRIETSKREKFLIERSADNFITNVPWAVDLCRRIGFADQLLPTSSENRGALVVCRGRLERVPEGFMLMAPARWWPIATSPILSMRGKLRLFAERFVPRRGTAADESLAEFARRRLGDEVFSRLVQPLVGGIYAADPDRLSLQATMPRFVEMERRWGSLTRGVQHQPASEKGDSAGGGARYGLFVAPRNGLTSLVQALAARLPGGAVRLNTPVEGLAREASGRWRVRTRDPALSWEADAVVLAVPASAAGRILTDVDAALATLLGRIDYAGTAIVSLVYRRSQIAHSLNGFGFVVPAIEKRQILAGSFASVKFAGRAPDDCVLIRVFIGGACQAELAQLADAELTRIATSELGSLIGAQGAAQWVDIARWPRSMPQYHVGHTQLVDEIEARVAHWPGLALAGNAYHGVGIPHCIHSGEAAAERIRGAIAQL